MQDTPDILKRILARKAEEISERKARLPEKKLKAKTKDCPPVR